MALRYGRHWLDLWAGLSIAQVKTEWSGDLARFHPVQVTQAIRAAGKFPPTLPEFAALCAQMPMPKVPHVDTGPALLADNRVGIPEKIKAALAAFHEKHRMPGTRKP